MILMLLPHFCTCQFLQLDDPVFCCLQIPLLTDPTSPEPAPMPLPELDASQLSAVHEHSLFENTILKGDHTESPDSGHKEMSSDSLSDNNSQWYTPMSRYLSGGSVMSSTPKRPNFNLPLKKMQPDPTNPFSDVSTIEMANLSQVDADKDATFSSQNATIITPLSQQDATGNKLELGVAPRIDPPPKVKRNSSRHSGAFSSSDVAFSPDSNGNSKSNSANNLVGSTARQSLSSTLLSDKTDKSKQPVKANNKVLNGPLSEKVPELQKNVNNLNQDVNSNVEVVKKTPLIMQNSADSTTKVRLSFSDEDNSEDLKYKQSADKDRVVQPIIS